MAMKHSIPPVYPAFPADIDRDAFGHWFSGFTDGEGCFYAGHDGRYRRAFFNIGIRADDRPILEQIRSFLGCGSFHPRPPEKSSHSPAIIFAVRDVNSLMNQIVPHFERYPLRAKKATDFAIWKQAVILLHRVFQRPYQGRPVKGISWRWTEADRQAFDDLASLLKEGRRFKPSEV